MHFYVSLRTKRGVVISGGGELVMKAKAPVGRRIFRSMLPAVLVIGVVLPFLFIRSAFLALDGAGAGAGVCSSINCIGWRLGPGLFVGGDASSRLANELTRALLETKKLGEGVVIKAQRGRREVGGVSDDRLPETFEELVAEAARKKLDVRSFVSKTKSLVFKMERKMQWAKKQRSAYRYLASIGVPNSIHCLCLRLADEYSTNSHARTSLPPPEYASRLKDKSLHHLAIISDNVLATRVVVASAVKASSQADKMVFHIITDKKTYAPMHAWFALNPVSPALVEVKSLHQYNWPPSINTRIIEMMAINHALQEHYFNNDRSTMMEEGLDSWRLDALRPSAISLLNHIRIYLPELLPELDKIVFLDDDVVVQQDLSPLWSLHLNGKVNGAVSSRMIREGNESGNCIGRVLGEYLNFSNPEIFSSGLKENDCAWIDGMNIYDLDAWRGTNISQTYHHWLKLNREASFALWRVGSLPPALIAFADHVHPIDPSWHVSGLGEEVPEANDDFLESAAVLHYSGPAKPWLPIAYPKLKRLWTVHINYSDEMMKSCGIID